MGGPIAGLNGITKPASQVSDEKGYVHLFLMLNVKDGEELYEDDPSSPRNVLTRQIGLNDTQAKILFRVGAEYNEFLKLMQAEAARILGPPEEKRILTRRERAQLPPFKTMRSSTVVRLRHELFAELDDQGDVLIENFVNDRIKPNIVFVKEQPAP